jgi:hypothetical protein
MQWTLEGSLALKSSLFLTLLVSLFVGNAASSQSIQCKMDTRANSHYIAPEINLAFGDFDEVSVKDAVIASTGRKAVVGKVSKDDAARLSVIWEVKNVPPDPKETRAYPAQFAVRLSIQKSNGAAIITLVDTVFRKFQYKSTGVCKVRA